MLEFPEIDPVAITLGPLQIHWYGLTYLVSFFLAWLLLRYRASSLEGEWTNDQVSDLLFYGAMGVVIGGRVGYMLFYNFSALLQDPVSLFYIWEGGMSFHGGFLGVILAIWFFSVKHKRSVYRILDFVAPVVPVGLGLVRIGNFINSELWGRPGEVPWAMIFPTDPLGLPRHPSQLYEFALEGIVMFLILWLYARKPRPVFAVSGMFCILYGSFRTFVEFFREPDSHLGYVAFDWMTRGMQLSIPMIFAGFVFMYLAYRHETFNRAKA